MLAGPVCAAAAGKCACVSAVGMCCQHADTQQLISDLIARGTVGEESGFEQFTAAYDESRQRWASLHGPRAERMLDEWTKCVEKYATGVSRKQRKMVAEDARKRRQECTRVPRDVGKCQIDEVSDGSETAGLLGWLSWGEIAAEEAVGAFIEDLGMIAMMTVSSGTRKRARYHAKVLLDLLTHRDQQRRENAVATAISEDQAAATAVSAMKIQLMFRRWARRRRTTAAVKIQTRFRLRAETRCPRPERFSLRGTVRPTLGAWAIPAASVQQAADSAVGGVGLAIEMAHHQGGWTAGDGLLVKQQPICETLAADSETQAGPASAVGLDLDLLLAGRNQRLRGRSRRAVTSWGDQRPARKGGLAASTRGQPGTAAEEDGAAAMIPPHTHPPTPGCAVRCCAHTCAVVARYPDPIQRPAKREAATVHVLRQAHRDAGRATRIYAAAQVQSACLILPSHRECSSVAASF